MDYTASSKNLYNEDTFSRASIPVAGDQAGSQEKKEGISDLTTLDLPRGGGAIKGIDEKFRVNAITGTSAFGVPIPLSPSRQGFIPAIGLTYNSAGGNSPFGLGWQVGLPSIARKTDKKLPEYRDDE